MTQPNTIEKFHERYIPEPNSGCWLWEDYSPNGRYGAMYLGKRGRVLAHVLSHEIHCGEVPEGMVLDHKCRNTFCVNPDHLEPVTQLINCRRSGPATKTHCVNGHPYSDGFETYIRKDKQGIRYRRCLTCYKIRWPNTGKI